MGTNETPPIDTEHFDPGKTHDAGNPPPEPQEADIAGAPSAGLSFDATTDGDGGMPEFHEGETTDPFATLESFSIRGANAPKVDPHDTDESLVVKNAAAASSDPFETETSLPTPPPAVSPAKSDPFATDEFDSDVIEATRAMVEQGWVPPQAKLPPAPRTSPGVPTPPVSPPSPTPKAPTVREPFADAKAEPTTPTVPILRTPTSAESTSNQETSRSARSAAPAPSRNRWIVPVLASWGLTATLAAVYLSMLRQSPTPLRDLPDNGKFSAIVSPLTPLESDQIIPLHATRTIDGLEITPLAIENRVVEIDPASAAVGDERSLVIRLLVRNISEYAFHPLDPDFLYLIPRPLDEPQFSHGYSYTLIQLRTGDQMATAQAHSPAVGSVSLPLDLRHQEGYRIKGQDFPRLNPGHAQEILIVSERGVMDELGDSALWRIHLRTGRPGKSTVIGVPFGRQDVTEHQDGK